MKDYKLSEIKKICEEQISCRDCPIREHWNYFSCSKGYSAAPYNWKIDKDEEEDNMGLATLQRLESIGE